MPDSETLVGVGLNSSTKSFVYGAPELPPPPYTWLITSPVPAVFAVAGETPTSETSIAATPRPRTTRMPAAKPFIIPPRSLVASSAELSHTAHDHEVSDR